ncbi:MAG: alpha/beta fold hydrolase [Steroidobacteraceae bacterium]
MHRNLRYALYGALSLVVLAAERSRLYVTKELPADAERVSIPVAAGARLSGLVFHPAAASDTGYWMLQLHGNGDSAFSPWQLRHCQALRREGFAVMDIDYRGFGMTPGIASEAGMYEDAEAAYKALVRRGVPPSRIILLGHSLGSGPAALVLFGAFTSIPDAAADRYPLLPVRYAASIQFDSLARISDVHMPVIVTHSRSDTLVPYSHALRLFAQANEPKLLITFESPANDGFGGHVDTLFEHLDELKSALAGMLPPQAPAREI